MSGRGAMPQPSMARVLVPMPGCSGRYVPITQDTESPKKVTRGSCPASRGRPGRSIGAGCRVAPEAVEPGAAVAGLMMITGAAVVVGGGGAAVDTPMAAIITP